MGLRLKAKTPSVMSLLGWSASMPTRSSAERKSGSTRTAKAPPGKTTLRSTRLSRNGKTGASSQSASGMPRRTGHRNRTGQMAGSRNPFCLYDRISSLLCPVFSGQRFGSIPSQATERLLVLRDILACCAASDHDRPTGDVQDNAGDPRCIIRSEVESCVRDVLGYSETPDRMPFDEILLLTRGNARLVSLGQDRFRSNAVRPNSIRTDLGGEILSENFDTGLGGRIGDRGHGIRPARGGR